MIDVRRPPQGLFGAALLGLWLAWIFVVAIAELPSPGDTARIRLSARTLAIGVPIPVTGSQPMPASKPSIDSGFPCASNRVIELFPLVMSLNETGYVFRSRRSSPRVS